MPIPKTWIEELAYEWLQLKGYLAISNVRLRSGKGGGTEEADLIGVRLVQKPENYEGTKIMKEVLEVVHAETGILTQKFEENLKSIKRKFAVHRIEAIKKIALSAVGLESILNSKSLLDYPRPSISEVDYKKIYVATYVAKGQIDKLKSELKKDDIDLLTLKEFLFEVITAIDDWRSKRVKMGIRKSKNITLPESMWLLNLIDAMRAQGFLINTTTVVKSQ